MELKRYQKGVLNDLDSYLTFLNRTNNIGTAYNQHWNSKGFRVGFGGMPVYNDTIPGVPHVCFKVPTGGGKTFLACCSLRHIYKSMSGLSQRVAVWLVPSSAILEQTVRNLSDPQHPYHQQLQRDFGGKLVVYTKEQMLNGQNFTPTAIIEQMSVCVMSFDSLRSAKKDGRKVYQENGNLAQFAAYYHDPSVLLADTAETALIQVLRYLTPVVIVDESHNAQSELSVEMLNNLNPCFVLDLTATPKSNSNVISCVNAVELKKENMVKLPVVVFNRATPEDVVLDAVRMRKGIEEQAQVERANGGEYIRPIVLFQAQPKGTGSNATFEKLKKRLVDKGIPSEQIAIKTADINELKNVDLQSPNCPIRYIITINALKEGWDCPFAYILATLTNKSSSVDVEQIVGRILRQPYAHPYLQSLLNTSYVMTCSDKFFDTLQKLIDGLKLAGFSKDEYRLGNPPPEQKSSEVPVQTTTEEETKTDEATLDGLSSGDLSQALNSQEEGAVSDDPVVVQMKAQQQAAVDAYEQEIKEQEETGLIGGELGSMMNQIRFRPSVAGLAESLLIPKFCVEGASPILWDEKYIALTKESLSKGFSLNAQPADVNFDTSSGDAYVIDLPKDSDGTPKYVQMRNAQLEYFREKLSRMAPADAKRSCALALAHQIGEDKITIPEQFILEYVQRVLETVDANMLSSIGGNTPFYAEKIKRRIIELEDQYRYETFRKKLLSQEIFCRPIYRLPKVISPVNTTDAINNSLYSEEKNDMNNFEREVISRVSSLDICWWHRIMDRGVGEFYINGFINMYPDFMILTQKGNLVLLETKGHDRDNTDSYKKLFLGTEWANKAGSSYHYFMVFDQDVQMQGSLTIDEFFDVMQKL